MHLIPGLFELLLCPFSFVCLIGLNFFLKVKILNRIPALESIFEVVIENIHSL